MLKSPNIFFEYSKDKDIWSIVNKGKASDNSSSPTKVYELLVAQYSDNPTEKNVADFIDEYLKKADVAPSEYKKRYESEWLGIADEYHKRATRIFGTDLPNDITAYLTINNRCPYSIVNDQFYVTFPRETIRKTIMHELWHFYTWYGLGVDQEENLGKQKYNDMKESLTVILNEECADLMPERIYDNGYPQHQELREELVTFWKKNKDIRILWEYMANKKDLLIRSK